MRYRRLSYRYAVMLSGTYPRLFEGFWQAERARVVMAHTHWRPPADVYETTSHIVVTVELPGVDPDELEVLLFEDALVVEGQRRLPMPESTAVYHAVEIRQGPFRLEVPLPTPIRSEDIDAHYEQGLLSISLPKSKGEV